MPKFRPRCLLNAADDGGHDSSVVNSPRLQTDDADPVKDDGNGVNAVVVVITVVVVTEDSTAVVVMIDCIVFMVIIVLCSYSRTV